MIGAGGAGTGSTCGTIALTGGVMGAGADFFTGAGAVFTVTALFAGMTGSLLAAGVAGDAIAGSAAVAAAGAETGAGVLLVPSVVAAFGEAGAATYAGSFDEYSYPT